MLVIPRNTRFDETAIIHDGDVIIGANCTVDYGIFGRKVIIGDKTEINGDVVAEELRMGAWCKVKGNAISKGDAFIGEFSSINGRLTVYGDLEIGRNVKIERGFEAKGLITIQDPLPVIVFIFLFLLELLRLGKLEEAEKLFDEELINPINIPDNSKVSLELIQTDYDAIFEESKVLGNVRARDVRTFSTELFGSITGRNIVIDSSTVHGAVKGRKVYIINQSYVFGHIHANEVFMEKGCVVEGSIIGKRGVWIKDKVEIYDRVGEVEIQKDVSESISRDRG
uniref:Acyltransferase n=1 Tax=Geoglobus ahangari TaxID=113653 RepID=A0A7C3UL12_9EURY